MVADRSYLSVDAHHAHMVWHPWYKAQSPEVLAEAYGLCTKGNAIMLLNLATDNTGRI